MLINEQKNEKNTYINAFKVLITFVRDYVKALTSDSTNDKTDKISDKIMIKLKFSYT